MALEIILPKGQNWNSTFGNKPRKPLKRTPFKQKPKPWAKGNGKPTSAPKTPLKGSVSKAKTKVIVWSDRVADARFSLKIRTRDGKCMFPNCVVTDIKKLQCSHYIGRRHSATRYNDANCISLCWLHHFKDKLIGFEYQKQTKEQHGYDGQYTLFMKKWLGEKNFYELVSLGRTTANRSKIKMALMAELQK